LNSKFRRYWIVEKSERPLESRDTGNLRKDLQVPVKVFFDGIPISATSIIRFSGIKRIDLPRTFGLRFRSRAAMQILGHAQSLRFVCA
jgi:hypothetical protein